MHIVRRITRRSDWKLNMAVWWVGKKELVIARVFLVYWRWGWGDEDEDGWVNGEEEYVPCCLFGGWD